MSERREKGGWKIVAGIALLVLSMLAAYTAGYFALSSVAEFGGSHGPDEGDGPFYGRVFPHKWQATIYKPAARIESWICDKNIVAAY